MDDADNDAAEKYNIHNDLALQRLISESHLLDESRRANPGAQRRETLDIRLQALGSKESILRRDKMPVSHRRGMEAKAKEREERRRQEAKENGIILERPNQAKTTTEQARPNERWRAGDWKIQRRNIET